MSVKLLTQAWRTPCELSTQKLVLLALADNASDEGFCWPSIRTIARKCDLDPRSVHRTLDSLAELGLIQVVSGMGKGISNRYWILKQAQEGYDPTSGGYDPTSGGGMILRQGGYDRGSTDPSYNHQVQPSTNPEGSILFSEFWKLYPRKVSRKDAAKAWRSGNCDKVWESEMKPALLISLFSDDWFKQNGKYIPYPATWIRKERWKDREPELPPLSREQECRRVLGGVNDPTGI